MATQPQMQFEAAPEVAERPRWSAGRRVSFRFAVLYFALYCFTNQVGPGFFPIPKVDIPDLGVLPPARPAVLWTAAHVFKISTPLVYTGSGSGDKTYDWVLVFCVLVAAALGAIVWSVLDRRRVNYSAAYRWFHLFLRFAVGTQMVLYGMVKLVPLQMPFPFLTKLVEPYGNFSPMGVLWYSIGASPAYEMFVGSAELLGGILLFFPRTATLGALVCLADATEIFALNMTYDVPVKLFAAHLIVMSLVLLGPELRRIVRFFFTDGEPGAAARLKLFGGPRANRIAVWVQVVYGLLVLAGNGFGAWTSWHTYGGGAPKSALYGIWSVEEMSKNGEVRAALVTDKERWRRVIFDRPSGMTFQRMDDTFAFYAAVVDTKDGTVKLGNDKMRRGMLRYERAGADQMSLSGDIEGQRVSMRLKLVDRSKMMLVSRGFHWVQDYPFNR